MGEISIKTHLIIDSIDEEYSVNWCGKIKEVNPLIQNGLPIFVIIGNNSRIEMNTINFSHLENCAKRITVPKGREAFTSDKTRIYIKEANGNEKLMCIVTHNRIKHFIPISDKMGYK